jgi:hypothetical protein
MMKLLLYLYIFFLFSPLNAQEGEETTLLSETHLHAIRKAAERGDHCCQLILGLLYELGAESYQDLKEAMEWYWLSAKQGNSCAEKHFNLLIGNDRYIQLVRRNECKFS